MNTSTLVRRVVVFAAVVALVPAIQAGPKIGVLLKAKSAFWELAAKGARDAGAALEAEVIVKSPQSESDIGAQIQMLNTLIEQGCEALVIAPSSKDALVEPVAAAVTRGIRVVIIDTRLARDVAPVFVGTDQVEAGRAAGRLVAGLVADGDAVGVLRHNQTSGATEQREIGAIEALRAAHPHLVLSANIYASTERGMETARAALLLDQNPSLKAVLASGTPGTMAMLHVLRDRDAAGKIRFVGFGYNFNRIVAQAIESGAMDAWVAQLPEEMGRRGLEAAAALLRGETVEPVITTRFEVITRENQRDFTILALMID